MNLDLIQLEVVDPDPAPNPEPGPQSEPEPQPEPLLNQTNYSIFIL